MHRKLHSFFDILEKDYVNDRPLHVRDKDASMFDIMTWDQFQCLSIAEIQRRHRIKHFVITNCPTPNAKFDESGLEKLGGLHQIISIQGKDFKYG